uniref:Transmembrane protein n=1 Tax=Steinernema glaseri TaxID=37863 RepID=A0A1I7Z2G0_9BILA
MTSATVAISSRAVYTQFANRAMLRWALLLPTLLGGLVSSASSSDGAPVVTGEAAMMCSRVVCDGVVNATTSDYATTSGEIVDCADCGVCGRKGFSACLRDGAKCLCDHFLPESCEEEKEGVAEEYCYRRALKKLPAVKPHVKEAYTSIDVIQFWLQPYWSSLQPERLVFHYKYKELVPEFCMGTFVAKNVCVSSIDMDMSQDFDGMDWPLELQIDNEVFDHTEQAEFWITVDVLEPSYTRGNVWVNVSSDVTTLDLRSDPKESGDSQESSEDSSAEALKQLPAVKPHVKEAYTSIDVIQFWLQPYWSSLQPERLVFHYKYKELVGPFPCHGFLDSAPDPKESGDSQESPEDSNAEGSRSHGEFLKDYGIYLIVAGAVAIVCLIAIAVYCNCRSKEKQGYVAGKAERA